MLKRLEEIAVLGNGFKLTAGQPAVETWEPVANEFLALLREHELPIYFMLDEFPWFLGHVAANHTAAEVDAALNWFRKVRLELADGPTRFLVTGSIGLTGLLRRLAQEILRELCRADRGFGRDDFDALHARLVPDPAHRELLSSELDYVLEVLRHDGYLFRCIDPDPDIDGRHLFASHMLRDFWRHRTA